MEMRDCALFLSGRNLSRLHFAGINGSALRRKTSSRSRSRGSLHFVIDPASLPAVINCRSRAAFAFSPHDASLQTIVANEPRRVDATRLQRSGNVVISERPAHGWIGGQYDRGIGARKDTLTRRHPAGADHDELSGRFTLDYEHARLVQE